jgi:sugar/nucleoside kinase (ribokinase family)
MSAMILDRMPDRKGIIAAGNWIVDHVKIIDTWPSQDALANIQTEYRGTGGAPFNLLVDLARLGASFPLAGAGIVGDDEPGHWVIEICRKHGIDTTLLQRTLEAPTSYTDVMTVERTGRRTFFHQRGANALLDANSIPLSETEARFFHLGYLLLLDRLDQPCKSFGTRAAELLHAASERGLVTSVDVVSEESDRFSRVVLPALPHIDLIFLNEFEAARIISYEVRVNGKLHVPTLLETADALLNAGVRRWVIIHFPEGVLAASKAGGRLFQPSVILPPSAIAGAAGMGDAIAAGILLGYHDDLPMEEGLIFGVCAAAASLTHPSCTEGVGTLEECLQLGYRYEFREPIL